MYVVDELRATKDTHSESLAQYSTPDEASVEFGILLDEIVQELEKDEARNLRTLKTVSSALTVQKNSNVHVFTGRQLEEIRACNDINTLLIYKLRHCYRWDDLSMLNKLMSSIKSKRSLSLLKNFEVKMNSKMKLQQIYEHCKNSGVTFSEDYHKLVAIVENKIFSDITLDEYSKLRHFVSEQYGVEDYAISPFIKASSSSLKLEWYIPVTAVAHMTKKAVHNKKKFTAKNFVYLKISSTVILDEVSVRIYCIKCVDNDCTYHSYVHSVKKTNHPCDNYTKSLLYMCG